ncbi:MAG: molybdopterin-guanine dinucleotide biosynthesis protein B [candidate division Zixibacteria bacterium]|nr:molybdopterin-guanine dinucleotide biosynthesis protein B [candidate division Zixibacteria bacterium]
MRILLVVGRKKRGKTTLLEKLVPEFKSRGYKVGSIKYTTGDHVFDIPGKDSFRHAQAGAESTLILSPHKIAFFSEHLPRGNAEELLEFLFEGYDLIIGEGFTDSPYAKVEVMDSSRDRAPLCGPQDNLLAVVCEGQVDAPVPVFSIKQIEELADHVEENLPRQQKKMKEAD